MWRGSCTSCKTPGGKVAGADHVTTETVQRACTCLFVCLFVGGRWRCFDYFSVS